METNLLNLIKMVYFKEVYFWYVVRATFNNIIPASNVNSHNTNDIKGKTKEMLRGFRLYTFFTIR